MKVFSLCCEHDHPFEGWFASAEDYKEQQEKKLLECPMCNSAVVRRLPSAPRLNLSGAADKPAPLPVETADGEHQQLMAPTPAQMQELWMKMASQIRDNTEDVGERFAEEAKAIHYNEAPERGIRGNATPEQAAELVEEGIEVMAFPMPAPLKGPLQ